MHVPRLYTPGILAEGEELSLTGQAAHHVVNVLRLKSGATIQVFDGQGHEHRASITTVNRSEVGLNVCEAVRPLEQSQLDITLLQGIARNDHMDIILQKAAELGVNTIQPLWMQRSQTHLKQDRLEKRVKHWEGVIINACEQCGRATLPALLPALIFPDWFNATGLSGTGVMLQPESSTSLKQLESSTSRVSVLVGPEGGITGEEQAMALSAGFQGIRLGPRILRTETAALAAISAIQTLWGDFG
jgi:16S rRNA (uracil1498-N3)-methyltransferase